MANKVKITRSYSFDQYILKKQEEGFIRKNDPLLFDVIIPLACKLVEVRHHARMRKDFKTADDIQKRLSEVGLAVTENVDGYTLGKKPGRDSDWFHV